MEQLTQNLKNGAMQLLEVPFPALSPGQVLVRNHFSLISAGTEGKTVKDARMGYIGKARARKEEVKKVIQSARTIGVFETYKMVMNRLDAPAALGYSCAGEVIAIAEGVKDFQIGDHVACAGANAVHAEVVAVPINLCVKIDPSIPMDEAAFTTIGAIAMQGIRQADLRLAENCVVIGLGLIGQITLQLLKASGVKTIAIDINQHQVDLANENGADISLNRDSPQLEQIVADFTNGYGTDAVIICAATESTDPVDLAGLLCRKKGKVIIVGAVHTGFSRKNYYQKELDLRMSGSYGPGRYDREYEEKGIDYPHAYVRWTENRNMQAFAELLKSKSIDLSKLLSHKFEFKDAPLAYQLILDRNEPFTGIVLQYDLNKNLKEKIQLKAFAPTSAKSVSGLIGAGSFGQNVLLPAIRGKTQLAGIATAKPNNARNIADKFGFDYCTGNADEIFSDQNINTVFIATRHNSHAEFVLKGLKNKKNIFVEKPLCVDLSELEEIRNAYVVSGTRLMVGFNRRFSPFIQQLKSKINTSIPSAIVYRINAGNVDVNHWVHDPEIGGGRIIGEVCHFIDLCSYLSNSPVKEVSAFSLYDTSGKTDTVTIGLFFENGSIANVSYFSNGNKEVNKEYIEVFNGGLIAKIDDFKELQISGKTVSNFKSTQDKGHKAELAAFIQSIEEGKPAPIHFEEIYNSTLATFRVLDSIALNGKKISIGNDAQ